MRLRPRTLATLSIAALLLAPLSACSSALTGASAPTVFTNESGRASDMMSEALPLDDTAAAPVSGQSVMSTGEISLSVDDVSAAVQQIGGIAANLDGYVESQSISDSSSGSSAYATITLRVPASSFDLAFERLAELGDVRTQNRSVADVTVQHVDLQARVEALQTSVDRLNELMRGAATTSELLEAEAALSARQQELDGLRAQLDQLESQIDRSTIWVQLSTETTIPGGPANFWEGLVLGLESIATAGAGALIVLGVALPWLIVLAVIAIIVVLILWGARRGARARRAAQGGPSGPTETAPRAPADPPYSQHPNTPSQTHH